MRVAVIPAVNEERTIGTVVLKTQSHVDQVIVVDDGSVDDTAEIAQTAGAQVLPLPHNRGKGAALTEGLRAAIKHSPEIVVLLDADGQHDPGEIPRLCEPIEAGDADLVIGSRRLKGDGQPSWARIAGRRLLDGATGLVGGSSVGDTQSGFRAVRGELVEDLVPREPGMGVESEMLVNAARSGLDIEEVDVRSHYPEANEPRLPALQHGASVFRSLLRLVRENHPLAFFGSLGTIALGLGIYFGYRTTTHYWATEEFWVGKAMLSMLLVILGCLSLMGALILDFISLKLRGPSGEGDQ